MKISNSLSNHNSYQTFIGEKNNKDFSHILNKKITNSDQQKLYKSCQELEAVFINKMLETMRSSIAKSDFFPQSFATDIYEGMLFDEYSQQMSKTSTFGIAEMMYKQLLINSK